MDEVSECMVEVEMGMTAMAVEEEAFVEEAQTNDANVEVTQISKAMSNEIVTYLFTGMRVPTQLAQEIQDTWSMFVNSASSREAAVEALYAALCDDVPSWQSLFKTPRAATAAWFLSSTSSAPCRGVDAQLEVVELPVAHKDIDELNDFDQIDPKNFVTRQLDVDDEHSLISLDEVDE